VLQNVLTPRERKAARLNDDLVQMVVHDMQSPIMVLMAQLSMLREDAPRRMVDRVDEAIGGAKTLSRMTSNLLDVNRFAARRMPIEREPTDVAAVARGVVSSMSLLEPGRVIELSGDASAMCCCDADLVRRILENLVSNAIKHSPIEGKVRVYVTSAQGQGAHGSASPRGGHVRVAVQDEGAGVPAEARQRIFEKFGVASLRTGSGYHSTGLGLAFCKLAVESHGGTIRLEDAIPHGSVFVVELPA
jgi:signal transduction histidine kinase